MRMKTITLGLAIALVASLALPAAAVTINPGNGSEMSLWDIINDYFALGNSSGVQSYIQADTTGVNGVLDNDFNDVDAVVAPLTQGEWVASSPKGAAIGLYASASQESGAYDLGTMGLEGPDFVLSGSGSVTPSNPTGVVAIDLPLSQPFGWYLKTTWLGSTHNWYSRNTDNMNGERHHLVAFNVKDLMVAIGYGSATTQDNYTSTYVLAWEDQNLGDSDYNDLVVAVSLAPGSSVVPVPEPATMTLLGLGLAGLAATRFRKRS